MKFRAGIIYTIEFDARDTAHAERQAPAYQEFLFKWNDAMGLKTGGFVKSNPVPEQTSEKYVGDVVEGRKAIEPYVTYTAEGDVDMVFCKSCVEETKLFAVKMPGYARNRDDVTCDRCKVAL